MVAMTEQGQGWRSSGASELGGCAGSSWPIRPGMPGQDLHDGSPALPSPCLWPQHPLWRPASGEAGDSHLYPEVMCFSLFLCVRPSESAAMPGQDPPSGILVLSLLTPGYGHGPRGLCAETWACAACSGARHGAACVSCCIDTARWPGEGAWDSRG